MRNPMVFFGIFAAIGIPCLILCFYFTFSTFQKMSTWEVQQGTITGFSQNNSPRVSFTHDGKTVEISSSYSSTGLETGQAITIHYPPGEPDQAEIKAFMTLWFLPLFLGIFGVVFGGIGVIGFLLQKKKTDAKNELFTQGRGKKITATIAGVNHDRSYTVNGVSPFRITVQYLDPVPNMVYRFDSERIWFDPSPFMEGKTTLDVYVDEQNWKRYYVDTTFLPKAAN